MSFRLNFFLDSTKNDVPFYTSSEDDERDEGDEGDESSQVCFRDLLFSGI